MDILIPDSWLKKFLDTASRPKEIAKYLSLSGPSVEKVTKTSDKDSIYHIEVTTNRVDSASVLGIAREASAILPRFGLKAKLKSIKSPSKKHKLLSKVDYLNAEVDTNLCPRFSAAIIRNVAVKKSPEEIAGCLTKVGVRPINNIVDVSNYVMHELGQPVHTFDYDKIKGAKMILRNSIRGEKLTTLDGKKFTLPGGDIVIEDGEGRLIDLCGIMGGENSGIDEKTKNVLLFVQTYNPHKIRKTSMHLAQRSDAAVLFEKGLDENMVNAAMISAINLIEKLAGGISDNAILNIHPRPYKGKDIITNLSFLNKIIGIAITNNDVKNYLTSLGFGVSLTGDMIKISVPSFRADDINIPEDIAEEVARIYGYHNITGTLMQGQLPAVKDDSQFRFEFKVKEILTSLGGIEVYNNSLTNDDSAGKGAIKLKNAMGKDSEYMRMSLKPSLIACMSENVERDVLHLFELSNVYIPTKNDLPREQLTLAGIIKGEKFRRSKGIIEAFLDEITRDAKFQVADEAGFLANQRIEIFSGGKKIGEYGNIDEGFFYYQFDFESLFNAKSILRKFKEPAKFPPQIESLTLSFPSRTKIGDVLSEIKNSSEKISLAELKDIFNDSYTFEVRYQDKSKTLVDSEVEAIRKKIIGNLKTKFGGNFKE